MARRRLLPGPHSASAGAGASRWAISSSNVHLAESWRVARFAYRGARIVDVKDKQHDG